MNTTDQKQETIVSELTMLLPFAEYDIGKFIQLHRADKNNNMGRFCLKEYTEEQAIFYITKLLNSGEIFAWTVYTNEEYPKFVGFIYLSNVTQYMVSMHGIMDMEFAKYSRKDKMDKTYAEDAQVALVNYCFEKGVHRIETDICESNRSALALVKRVGFIKEGVLRDVVIKDKGFENLVVLSILKDEYGQK